MKKVKVIERSEVKLKDLLGNDNPWGEEGCGAEKCIPCDEWHEDMHGKRGRCMKTIICYRITCRDCAEMGIKSVYIGEISRSGRNRAK